MDMIGLSASDVKLCKRLYANANTYWLRKDAILAEAGTQRPVDAICARIQGALATIGGSNKFHLVIAAERIMCYADLMHFQRQQHILPDVFPPDGIMRSLREGADRMEEINRKLAVRAKDIAAFHRYSSDVLMEKGDHDGGGLPKDGIRKILASHKTRLDNRSKAFDSLSREERSLIHIRQSNIQTAERLYKAMQREALGK